MGVAAFLEVMTGRWAQIVDRERGGARKAIVALLAAIALLLIGLVVVVRNWRGTVIVVDHSTPEPVRETPAETRDLIEQQGIVMPMSQAERRILNQHFAAVGGVNQFISMSSVRVDGDLNFADGRVHSAVLVRKGRERERITVKTPEQVQVSVVTPEDSWIAHWSKGELQRVEALSPADRLEMARNAPVVDELYAALQGGLIMQYLGQRDFNYKMAHVFEIQHSQRQSTRFFIDPQTLLNIGREDRAFGADGTLNITRRIYSEHLDASGLTIPGKVETTVNDAWSRTFHVHQAELNPGVLDSVFLRPAMPPVTP